MWGQNRRPFPLAWLPSHRPRPVAGRDPPPRTPLSGSCGHRDEGHVGRELAGDDDSGDPGCRRRTPHLPARLPQCVPAMAGRVRGQCRPPGFGLLPGIPGTRGSASPALRVGSRRQALRVCLREGLLRRHTESRRAPCCATGPSSCRPRVPSAVPTPHWGPTVARCPSVPGRCSAADVSRVRSWGATAGGEIGGTADPAPVSPRTRG